VSPEPRLVETLGDLEDLARVLAALPADRTRIGLDTESNGLFAYRSALCLLQLAYEGESGVEVAIVDTLALGCEPLRAVLESPEFVKVLHDLHFDARLLASQGIVLRGVRDTSISARYLGAKAAGLAAVLQAELGVPVEKALQRHDWSKRPLRPCDVAYLATDVAHLLALDRKLGEQEEERGIATEVRTETEHRLRLSLDPPPEVPPYLRVRGVTTLDPVARAVLRRLAAWREQRAEQDDRPPHNVVPADVLLRLAVERPSDLAAIRRLGKPAARNAAALRAAIQAGIADGDVPEDERAAFERRPPEPRRLRSIERALVRFRAEECARRGVSDQVVLPGHCVTAIAHATLTLRAEDEILAAIGAVPGIGEERVRRYGPDLAAMLVALPE
jgi:ribonuclease D